MADYYPLLARALDAMPDRSPALREAVYQRARSALIGQLRSLEPPLSEADIDLERHALDNAIARLERDHGGEIPPAEPVVSIPEPVPPAPEPFPEAVPEPEPEPYPGEPEVSPALPEAVPPPVATVAVADAPATGVDPVAEEQAEPAIRIQPRKTRISAEPDAARPDPPPFLGPDSATREPTAADENPAADASVIDVSGSRQRPRIDVVAPRGGRSRLVRNVAVGSILLAVIGLIAVAAFLLRDRPADLQPNTADVAGATADGADAKYADRIGGEAGPADRPAAVQNSTVPVQAAQQPDLAVSQRAVLYEENQSGGNAQPVTTQGRVVWRLENVSGEQGQPLETAVKANVEFPNAGLRLVLTMRRNVDATLPASHTIELAFTLSGAAGEKRSVQDIGLLQAKDEEGTRGSPVSGLPVRVRENLFLIGLSSLRSDIDRNTDLLLHRNWFDLAVKFASGQRGIIALEKGASGNQVLQKAFDQWR